MGVYGIDVATILTAMRLLWPLAGARDTHPPRAQEGSQAKLSLSMSCRCSPASSGGLVPDFVDVVRFQKKGKRG